MAKKKTTVYAKLARFLGGAPVSITFKSEAKAKEAAEAALNDGTWVEYAINGTLYTR